MLLKKLMEEVEKENKPDGGEIEPFNDNIEKITKENENFMKILYTSDKMQLSVMSLKPNEDIGMETHDGDQFIRIEFGTCEAVINDKKYNLEADDVIIVPKGSSHNITNTSDSNEVKLYTVYAPPQHEANEIKKTK